MKNLLFILVLISIESFSQKFSTFYKNNKVQILDVSEISFSSQNGYFVSQDDDGYYVHDIINQKKIFVRSKKGINLDKDTFINGFGVLKDKYFFIINYAVENGDDKFEIYYLEGEKVISTNFASDWTGQEPIHVLNSVYLTNDNIFFLLLPRDLYNSDSKSPYVGTRFDGINLHKVPSVGLPSHDLRKSGYVVNNMLKVSFKNELTAEYTYSNEKWMLTTELPKNTFSKFRTSCGIQFRVSVNGAESWNLTSDISGDKTIFKLIDGQEIPEMNFEHNNKYIFGFREDPEVHDLGKRDGLYISDGSAAGTKLLTQKVFLDRVFDKRVMCFSTYQNLTYFIVEGRESVSKEVVYTLWQTDGTDVGTKRLMTSTQEISKIINCKGIPVYAKFTKGGRAQLYEFVGNKEVTIVDAKNNYSEYFSASSVLELNSRYTINDVGEILILLGNYIDGEFITVVDIAPNIKYLKDRCSESYLFEALPTEKRFTPYIIAQSVHRKGMNHDNTDVADDMKSGDFTAEQLKAVNEKCYDELDTGVEFLILSFKALLIPTTALGLTSTLFTMANKFLEGDTTDFSDPELNSRAQQHPSTRRFVNNITNSLAYNLSKNARFVYDSKMLDYIVDGKKQSRKDIPSPTWDTRSDLFNGLGMAVHDTWGYDVSIEHFEIDEKSRRFQANLSIVIFDHFGLDPTDIDPKIKPNLAKLDGLRSWFILQHSKKYAMKPFVTVIQFNETLLGSF